MKRIIATCALTIALATGTVIPAAAAPASFAQSVGDGDGIVLPQPGPQLAETGAGDRALITLGFVGGGLLVAGAGVFALTAWRSSRR